LQLRSLHSLRARVAITWFALACWTLAADGDPVLAQANDCKSLTQAAVEEHSLVHYEEARALFARAPRLQPGGAHREQEARASSPAFMPGALCRVQF
jgi:hypothetical protein